MATDDGTSILEAWHDAQTLSRRARGMLYLGAPFGLVCAFVAGRFVLGYGNPGGWAFLAGLPVAIAVAAKVVAAKSAGIVRVLEKRIGTAGVAVLGLREVANDLDGETKRLVELKKAFLGALERRAVHIGGSPEDDQVRIRRLKKAIEDSSPSIEKLGSEVERLERAFQGAVGDPETPPQRWEEFARAYRQANAELEAVKTGLLH